MENLNRDNFDNFIQSNKKVVIDIWAPWCGPCRMLGPVIEEVCEEKNIPLGKVNADDNDELCARFNCVSIPLVLLFENGKEVSRFVGYAPKDKIEEFLK